MEGKHTLSPINRALHPPLPTMNTYLRSHRGLAGLSTCKPTIAKKKSKRERFVSTTTTTTPLFFSFFCASQTDEACYQGFRLAVHALGTLDALLSLATVAKLPGYTRPVYRRPPSPNVGDADWVRGNHGDGRDSEHGGTEEEGGVITLRGARHPTVEQVLEGGFVPNDVNLR